MPLARSAAFELAQRGAGRDEDRDVGAPGRTRATVGSGRTSHPSARMRGRSWPPRRPPRPPAARRSGSPWGGARRPARSTGGPVSSGAGTAASASKSGCARMPSSVATCVIRRPKTWLIQWMTAGVDRKFVVSESAVGVDDRRRPQEQVDVGPAEAVQRLLRVADEEQLPGAGRVRARRRGDRDHDVELQRDRCPGTRPAAGPGSAGPGRRRTRSPWVGWLHEPPAEHQQVVEGQPPGPAAALRLGPG